jgi:hypothetical protein
MSRSGQETRGASASTTALHGAHIQCPPSASSLTGVVPAATVLTDPAPTGSTAGGPDPADQNLLTLVEFDRLHYGFVHAQKGVPHPGVAHAVLRSCDPGIQTAQNVCKNGVSPLTAPRSTHG